MSGRPIGALPPGQDRAALVAEVRRVLDDAVGAGDRVVLAVSGGPDSAALAYLVTEARPDLDACVAHVRHGLRDDAGDATVAAVHAHALGLAYHERSVTVRPAGEGLEAAARDVRYAALADVARAVGARAVLVGHTADDQAETVVLNIARGAGLRGLAGMPVSRSGGAGDDRDPPGSREPGGHARDVRVVRPLLHLRREDVHAFVAGEGLRAVSDPTNRDPWQRRSRARYEVLPALAALPGGAGDPVGALTRLADLARDDADALDRLAASCARRLVRSWGPARAVPTGELARLPQALARRVTRLFLRGVRGQTELSSATVTAVLALEPGEAAHIAGGVWVTCGGGWLGAVPPGTEPLAERPLPVPGAVDLPELGVVVRTVGGAPGAQQHRLAGGPAGRGDEPAPASLAPRPPGAPRPPFALVYVPSETSLVVRGRRPGDRLADARLTDVLSSAGVPRALRDLVPVVADAAGRILWVAGLAPPPAEGGDAGSVTPPGGRAVRVWLAAAGAGTPRTVV